MKLKGELHTHTVTLLSNAVFNVQCHFDTEINEI